MAIAFARQVFFPVCHVLFRIVLTPFKSPGFENCGVFGVVALLLGTLAIAAIATRRAKAGAATP